MADTDTLIGQTVSHYRIIEKLGGGGIRTGQLAPQTIWPPEQNRRNSLGYADAYADDLSDCFNMAQSPIPFQTTPAPISASAFLKKKGPALDPDDD